MPYMYALYVCLICMPYIQGHTEMRRSSWSTDLLCAEILDPSLSSMRRFPPRSDTRAAFGSSPAVCVCVKRDLHVRQKRPTYTAKETYIYGKRDLDIWQKRPRCTAKETYVYGKRDLLMTHARVHGTNLHWQTRDIRIYGYM